MNKKLLSLIIVIIAIAMPAKLWAQEPYAVLSEENTVLTFYYDENKENRGGLDIEFNMNNYNINIVLIL